MSPRLEDFPNEVIESITRLLVLRDICSLRQTSQALATKTTQHHFKSYFHSKHVDITKRDLQELVSFTQPGSLGCLIQHLVLVGVVKNTEWLNHVRDEESDWGEEEETQKKTKAEQDLETLEQRQIEYDELHGCGGDTALLSEAFSNIARNTKAARLMSLSLEVVVYRKDAEQRIPPLAGGSWKFIWQCASDTFHTAMRSLAMSMLPIEKLNIFNDRRLQRCSLACNELGNVDFEDKGLARSLASLKSLSISFSDKVIFQSRQEAERSYDPAEHIDWDLTDEERDIDEIRTEAANEDNFIGLAKLLALTIDLEDLELHQYQLEKGALTHTEMQRDRLMQRMAKMERSLNLKRIEFRGLYIREQDLLVFLQRTNVRSLFMYNVDITSGSFRSVFNYCTSNAAGIEELYFDKLSEGMSKVYFEGPRQLLPPQVVGGDLIGADTLNRVGSEVKRKIIYGTPQVFIVSSPAVAEHRRQQRIEYGPPTRGFA